MQIFDIACFGTSLTAGSGFDPNDPGQKPYGSFVPKLALSLAAGKQSRVRAYNFGVPGASSTVGMATYLQSVQKVRPRAVLVEFMMNDCALLSQGDSKANHLTIINTLKALPVPPAIYLVTMNPVVGNSASAVARLSLNTFNDIYRALSVSQGVGLIDTYPNWNASLADIPDGVHPTLPKNVVTYIPQAVAALSPQIA